MIIKDCFSYENCPCLDCDKHCCVEMEVVNTDKLCERARIHCENCYRKHQEEKVSKMTYKEILEKARIDVKEKIIDFRPACGLYVDGMDDCEQIPYAIVCWLENGNKIIYIVEKGE